MAEELKLIPRPTQAPAPTTRDIVAVFFRQKKIFWRSFSALFAGVLLYGVLFPSYKAEMKILLRRARIDAMAAPTPSQSPQITRDDVTEEELNSEAEMLTDADILRTVAQASGLADNRSWIGQAMGENQEQHLARTVRRLLRKLDVQPGKRANVIDVSYTSSDPERSALVLHSLANAYLERHEQIRRPAGEFDFFDRQMAQARANLEKAEGQLLDFTHDEGVISAAAAARQHVATAESDRFRKRADEDSPSGNGGTSAGASNQAAIAARAHHHPDQECGQSTTARKDEVKAFGIAASANAIANQIRGVIPVGARSG